VILLRKLSPTFLRGLFHWKLDTTDAWAYSLAPADYPRLPLFSFKGSNSSSYLNQLEVFWLVYDDATSWRSLSFYQRPKVEDVEALAESEFAAIPEASLPACPNLKISKPFQCVLPCWRGGYVTIGTQHRQSSCHWFR
jgi:hypothetical protein